MNALSLFNGMSCGLMALEKCGIRVNRYYSSEIDKYANQATQALFPYVEQLGDVTKWRDWDIDFSRIDLVTGGFPCQAWSMAGKHLGDKDERGMLFWTMLDIMKHVMFLNPKAKFLIENVKMKKEFEEYITKHTENALGRVDKILINSALVSAQNRNRYYWTNIRGVKQPKDKGIFLNDIIESSVGNGFFIGGAQLNRLDLSSVVNGGVRVCFKYVGENVNKSECLQARDYKGMSNRQYFTVVMENGGLRRLAPLEFMRLQTVPEHHIDTLLNAGLSNTQLYKMTGNAWTVDVIAHIFNGIKKPRPFLNLHNE